MAQDIEGMLPVGTVLRNRYRIEQYLASGGFGNTYKVYDSHLDDTMAIKEFFNRNINHRDPATYMVTVSNSSNTADFENLLNKFRKEARRIRKLRGAHIVHVHDLFDDNGTAYYVMDFIDGESLQSRLRHRGAPMPEKEVLGYLQQMLDGLDEIHRYKIWHLDIKPGNMMLDRDGNLMLIDFGASKMIDTDRGSMTSSVAMAYTPGYAPIEQTEQKLELIGAPTDLFAIGATLYTLLTNSRPPSLSDMIEDGVRAFSYPESVSADMRHLISWLMKFRRDDRPQNVDEVRQYVATHPFTPPVVVAELVADDDVTIVDTPAPAPQAAPAPKPQPVVGTPMPEPKPVPKPEPKPVPKPEPKPVPKPEPKPEPASRPQPVNGTPMPKVESVPGKSKGKNIGIIAGVIGVVAAAAIIGGIASSSGDGEEVAQATDSVPAVEAVDSAAPLPTTVATPVEEKTPGPVVDEKKTSQSSSSSSTKKTERKQSSSSAGSSERPSPADEAVKQMRQASKSINEKSRESSSNGNKERRVLPPGEL
jgi:serine/threonine protein kinase